MSHFGALIHVPGDTDLADLDNYLKAVLKPFDENRQVEPYKKFEDGGPENYWWVEAVRRNAASLAEGKEPQVGNGGGIWGNKVWSHKHGKAVAPEVARADALEEWREDVTWAERLGERPSWHDVVRLYRAKYHPGTELAVTGTVSAADLPDGLLYDEETDRAYEWTTYNPDSKWDWWAIGGRWNDYFPLRGDLDPREVTRINGQPGAFGPNEAKPGHWVDGGRKGQLDLERMRREAGAKAEAEWEGWMTVVASTPEANSWSHFVGLVQVGEMDIKSAREAYHAQPRIQAAKTAKLADDFFGDCPIDRFMVGLEEFTQRARNNAVPGYALITNKGEWVAAGRMGTWGVSSDGPDENAAYKIAVNRYIDDAINDNDLLIALDLHI